MRRNAMLTVIVLLIMLMPSFVFAETGLEISTTANIDDGYYFETVIESETNAINAVIANIMARGTNTKTKSKTTYCKNASGNVMWYVKVTGTFTYGNGSAKCTKSVCTAESKDKTWKVSGKSSSKSGNKASATAKGTHYLNGVPVETISRTVTLKCSPTGNFS